MQRQSLGGSSPKPSSKLVHGGITDEKMKNGEEDEQRRKSGDGREVVEDDEVKIKHRSNFPIEKSIHLIPIFIFSVFLILYLCSHDPLQSDLPKYSQLRRSSKKLDLGAIDELESFLDVKKGDVLAIRSHRSLQEAEKSLKTGKFHRKLGCF